MSVAKKAPKFKILAGQVWLEPNGSRKCLILTISGCYAKVITSDRKITLFSIGTDGYGNEKVGGYDFGYVATAVPEWAK